MRLLILLLTFAAFGNISAQPLANGTITKITLQSPQLNAERGIYIYLPHNYYSSNKKYPVIYMHDAQNLFDDKTAFAGEWRVDETLDSLKAQVIVVGIMHGNETRLKELTPYPNPEYGGGEADTYLDFLVHTVKPYIDTTYRVKTSRRHTYIFGSSLGGLVSYYALLKYPEVFAGAGIFSPSFWFTDDIYRLTENTKKMDAKLYFMAGDSESEQMVSDVERMINLLKQKVNCKNIKLKIIPGGKHNEALWSKQFAEAYLWLILGG
ncbi:alpha/beta hydrolase-fold protein [Flavobacterium coralii]|uniref:alpha/beta hydrolase n=1 Tax=Flavobacterium coralii TaxID=2838017 RepID=UPI000C5CB72B|nr:alpha-mannosidase [Flavobacterium sp.]|tara:strand:+ start:2978 stop:3772 length:795 start_codon:yes stop_codon:yes gene_type:complete